MWLTTAFALLLTFLLAVNGVSSQDDYDGDYAYSDYYDDPVRYNRGNALSETDITPLIINGTRANEGQIPYQALLSTTTTGDVVCGGSLISTRYVVTAAHCVINRNTGLYVSLGVTKISTSQLTNIQVTLADITIHPNYDSNNYQNDIALIRLPANVVTNANIKTIRLPRPIQRLPVHFVGRIGRISGWGLTTSSVIATSDDLMYANVRIAPNLICRAEVRRSNNDGGRWFHGNRTDAFRWNQLCTRDRSWAGTCFGDSGGPLAITEKDGVRTLVGIISFLYGDTCENSPVYGYTFVGAYLRWIEQNSDVQLRGKWRNDRRWHRDRTW